MAKKLDFTKKTWTDTYLVDQLHKTNKKVVELKERLKSLLLFDKKKDHRDNYEKLGINLHIQIQREKQIQAEVKKRGL
ncbi:MAG: hypothetical protein HRT98_04455 [Mycoplasmatales bacterium]|nr:hypothetical protein [Mycoplasmatales bacterium]